jgi:Ser/Thr protein kinase RdoA (MazF antagonist)
MLSNRQQVARLRRVAGQALGAYPLAAPEMRFIPHGENTTFRVDAMVAGGRARFLLRVHRPARHGRRLDPETAVGSELDWLTALRADTGLSVPEPVRTTSGKLTTAAASPDVPEPRVCSLLRWMDGRVHSSAPRPVHLRRLGTVMARLHNHAAQWCPPPGFTRIRWDWENLLRRHDGLRGINAADVWDLIPADLRRQGPCRPGGMRPVPAIVHRKATLGPCLARWPGRT